MYFKKESWWRQKTNLQYWQLFLISLISLLILMFSANLYLINRDQCNKVLGTTEKHELGYRYISPLLECADSNNLYSHDLENKLNKIINNNIKKGKVSLVSLYYRDLNNGPWIGINENEEFSPASLLKVPLMIAYLKMTETEPSILKEKIKINNHQNLIAQNINPKKNTRK
jgi:beta-lactamase class A